MRTEKPKVFLSYRREDPVASSLLFLICEILEHRFEVFYDIDSIPAGARWDHFVADNVRQSSAVVAVIGDTVAWLGGQDPQTARIWQAGDFVRFELETALQEQIPIVPLLLKRARMPAPVQIPDSLRDFCKYNASEAQPGPDFRTRIAALMDSMPLRHQNSPAQNYITKYLPRAPARTTPENYANLQTLEGHSSGVLAVRVTADGRRAVSAGWDDRIRVWDIAGDA